MSNQAVIASLETRLAQLRKELAAAERDADAARAVKAENVRKTSTNTAVVVIPPLTQASASQAKRRFEEVEHTAVEAEDEDAEEDVESDEADDAPEEFYVARTRCTRCQRRKAECIFRNKDRVSTCAVCKSARAGPCIGARGLPRALQERILEKERRDREKGDKPTTQQKRRRVSEPDQPLLSKSKSTAAAKGKARAQKEPPELGGSAHAGPPPPLAPSLEAILNDPRPRWSANPFEGELNSSELLINILVEVQHLRAEIAKLTPLLPTVPR
ncbi:hypothetical protein C2E23DRAFT_889451 [Lenzites betulinus]|nr:hypothetical protein C2E23DRAFT_889451 [Lenzites betulinus]